MKKNKGFTLVELLVVIAIIGILSSVVFASLNSARGNASLAAGQSYAAGLQPAVVLCNDANSGAGVLQAYVVGAEICNPGISTPWPTIPSSWAAGTLTATAGNGSFALTCAAGSCATAQITCTVNGTSATCQ